VKDRRHPLFELLLLAFPRAFREAFSDGMRDAFADAHTECRASLRRLMRLWARTAVDMTWSGIKERRHSTQQSGTARATTRGWSATRFSLLDLKLGLRMLVKYPGLTIVTMFALAIGIPVGLTPTHLANAVEAPLPVPDGHEIRLLRYWNQASRTSTPTTFYDLLQWRDGLTTFESLGAVRASAYNVDSNDGLAPPVQGAEVTASTFDVLRVAPFLGRTLGAADEVRGAPFVAIIGYDLWQSRLTGDPEIIGRDVRIGGVPHTIVGVMPQGFLFPIRQQLWLPLRESPTVEPREGAPLTVFGRLRGRDAEDAAQAELTTVGGRMALAFPQAQEWLQPEVVPFSYIAIGGAPKGGLKALPEFYVSQMLTIFLLMVACANVGMLIFARTAARSGELAVRTALGASRSRIISQVFTEALVLAVFAAGLGLLLLHWLPTRLISLATSTSLPYWFDLSVGLDTVLWALGLAVLSAAVAGIVPALQVTGVSVQKNIQRAQASRSGVRFGGMTSALIVADVAVAVATVSFAAALSNRLNQSWNDLESTGIEASQFLSAQLRFPSLETESEAGVTERAAAKLRSADRLQALVDRLDAEPRVRAVTVATALPRMDHRSQTIEVEGDANTDASQQTRVRTAGVAQNFFAALDQPILSGRGFDANDFRDGAAAVIVNTTFVDVVLGGRNPLGRRVRYLTRSGEGEPGPWLEIVGVVGRLGMHMVNPDGDQGLYRPLRPGEGPAYLAIRLGDDPDSFTPRLRTLANEVDASASIVSPIALDKVSEGDWYLMAGITLGGALLVGLLLALAASGIYAIMSFAVAERTRELGIRAALGSPRSSIAMAVAKRAMIQIGLGALLGTPFAWLAFRQLQNDAGSTYSGLFVFVAALTPGLLVVILVGLLACTAPTLRAMRITPTEALRS